MYKIKEILDHIAESNEEAILWDGFDDCIIGFSEKGVVIYEMSLMISTLMENDDMSAEDAIEYLEFNTWNCYVGDYTPIHIRVFDVEAIHKGIEGHGYDMFGF
ncbi:MAG: hypothetical protein ACTSQA_02170 [Candidatus Heimdallarchaeaceae archaeon]